MHLPRWCSKCGVECQTWLTCADKSLILVRGGDKTCWMAESYDQVADALISGRAYGGDELCEVKPNPNTMQGGKIVPVNSIAKVAI
jgi:hypothetical protein